MTLNPNNVTQGGLGSRQVQAVFCRRPLLFRAGLTIFIEMEYKKVLRRYNRMRRCFERRAKERGREEGEPPKKGQTGGGVGKKKTGVGVKKKTAGGVPKKKRAGWHKTYPRRYLENVVAAMAEKTDGWAGKKTGGRVKKKNGRCAWQKKRISRSEKKTGGRFKKKTGDGW